MSDPWADVRERNVKIGEQLQAARVRAGWSQAGLIERISFGSNTGGRGGFNVPTLSLVESGRSVPSPTLAEALTTYLGAALQDHMPIVAPTPGRSSDPVTSHTNRPVRATWVHEIILQQLELIGPSTHFEMIDRWSVEGYRFATEQRIRTATKELVTAGRVHATDQTRPNSRGRNCTVWSITR